MKWICKIEWAVFSNIWCMTQRNGMRTSPSLLTPEESCSEKVYLHYDFFLGWQSCPTVLWLANTTVLWLVSTQSPWRIDKLPMRNLSVIIQHHLISSRLPVKQFSINTSHSSVYTFISIETLTQFFVILLLFTITVNLRWSSQDVMKKCRLNGFNRSIALTNYELQPFFHIVPIGS